MNEILEDLKSERFTRKEAVLYGVLYPLALVACCCFAEHICRL